MSVKKWLLWLIAVCLVLCAAVTAFNILIDPFGVFGDPLFDWYAYDMTQNPRVAKLAYLRRHHGEYDSYVVGSSKVSSISCEELNEYLGGRFYNLTWYGGKLGDEIDAVNYLMSNYEVKNLVLMVEPQNTRDYRTGSVDLKERMHCAANGFPAPLFYASYALCNPRYALDKLAARVQRRYLISADEVYTPETGSYNKQRRDIEPVAGLAAYLEKDGGNFPEQQPVTETPYTEQCLEAVRAVRDRCEAEGVRLILMTAPQSRGEFLSYSPDLIGAFWRGLAEISDFWDFSGRTSIGDDPRYFYDVNHFRNSVGTMALARIFENDSVFVPDDFGVLVTRDNVEERLSRMWDEPAPAENSVRVPILMYHAVTEDPAEVTSMTITAARLEEHLKALRGAGYETVGYDRLLDYVQTGAPLPEKPLVITFDDGYESNLTYAAPLLERYGFSGQIAVIGCSIGRAVYKDTGQPTLPHFSVEEARPWLDAGVLALNSHTDDMHQVESLDGKNYRRGMRRLRGESEAKFIEAIRADCQALEAKIPPMTPKVLTYPYGEYSELSEAVLREAGYDVTVTTQPGIAEPVRGLPQSLRALRRIAVTDEITPEELLAELAG